MSEQNPVVDEIWVNVTEASEITGYNIEHMRRLARENWKLPEEERSIRILKRSNRYDVWLPDVVNYVSNLGRGPQGKRK